MSPAQRSTTRRPPSRKAISPPRRTHSYADARAMPSICAAPPTRLRALHGFWFDRMVPKIGAAVGGDSAAYGYLPASAKRFPPPAELAAHMHRAGLDGVTFRTFMGGIVALHHGRVAP
mgnify:CR=1 FL=1